MDTNFRGDDSCITNNSFTNLTFMTKTNLESIKKEWEKWAEDKYYCDDKLVEKIAKFWLSKLQQRMDEIEGEVKSIKEQAEKIEAIHHEQFLKDEARYKYNPNANNLETMKMHEGSLSAYNGGINQGTVITCNKVLNIIKSVDKNK